jgi:hypothetical protein
MGMIVSNAFMKRAFGKRLIEDYLKLKDLTHVIDTSGVYLPGHGTPTTILIGRSQPPVAHVIRAVRGIRGETGVPVDPRSAPVWREICDHVDEDGFVGKMVSVQDVPRESFAVHPWAIGGGGAAELKEQIADLSNMTLQSAVSDVGVIGRSSGDEVFVAPVRCFNAMKISPDLVAVLAPGEALREWQFADLQVVLFPYSPVHSSPISDQGFYRWLWPVRTVLGNRITFAQKTYFEEGRPWWGWHQLSPHRLIPKETIAYGEIGTHNHFVFDRGGKVFNQTAPVIKLPADATEDQHLELLGLLNSSTACFWLKQVCFPKGGDTVGKDGARVRKVLWDVYFAFDSTKLKQFPIPDDRPLALTRIIQSSADARNIILPEKLCASDVPTRAILDSSRQNSAVNLSKMIAFQEELDWQCYRLYGIIDEDLTAPIDQVPPLELGQRTFEIRMAREMQEGTLETTWFERPIGLQPTARSASVASKSCSPTATSRSSSSPNTNVAGTSPPGREWNTPP